MSDNIVDINAVAEKQLADRKAWFEQFGALDEKRKLLDALYQKDQLSDEEYYSRRKLLSELRHRELLDKYTQYKKRQLSKTEYETARRKAVKEWIKEAIQIAIMAAEMSGFDDIHLNLAVEFLLKVEAHQD